MKVGTLCVHESYQYNLLTERQPLTTTCITLIRLHMFTFSKRPEEKENAEVDASEIKIKHQDH